MSDVAESTAAALDAGAAEARRLIGCTGDAGCRCSRCVERARRTVAAHAWALGYGDEDCPPAGEACGRLAASKHRWRSREWVLTDAEHEADACGDPVTAAAIRLLLAHHVATARPRAGSCPDDIAAAIAARCEPTP